MALNTIPIFISRGNFTPARIAAANTASDGSGALLTLVTAPTDGTRVDGVRFINSQVTAAAAGVLGVFIIEAQDFIEVCVLLSEN